MADNEYQYNEDPPQRNEEDTSGRSISGGPGGKIGCGCLIIILLIGGCTAAVFGGAFWLLQQSDAVKFGLEQANLHPQVLHALGTPIEAGLLIEGNIQLNNDDGHADIHLPISGPRGSASIHIVGVKTAGVWTFTTALCTLDDSGEQVNLLPLVESIPE